MIYQVQQTQSQCPQCSKNRKNKELYADSSSDQSDQISDEEQIREDNRHRIIIPLKKRAVEQNKNIQQTLNLLHKEIEKLNQENEKKDRKIRKLEFELTAKSNRLYPSNARIGSIYENQYQLLTKHQRFRSPQMGKKIYTQSLGKESDPAFANTEGYKQIIEIQEKMRQLRKQKNDRIAELQQELKIAQEKKEKVEKILDEEIKDKEWLTKFCLIFVNMTGKISKTQGESIIKPHCSLRKNTKIAWKYIKQFLNQVLS